MCGLCNITDFNFIIIVLCMNIFSNNSLLRGFLSTRFCTHLEVVHPAEGEPPRIFLEHLAVFTRFKKSAAIDRQPRRARGRTCSLAAHACDIWHIFVSSSVFRAAGFAMNRAVPEPPALSINARTSGTVSTVVSKTDMIKKVRMGCHMY